MTAPRVGDELAGYRLESVIARGGMSTVFLATHLGLARRVAIKFLATDLSEDDVFRERFVNESRIAAALDHPNVIPIYEAGSADGWLFLAMRYVKGPHLKSLIGSMGPLPAVRTLPIVSQTAGALDVAHENGLIHRDVKPGNILLDVQIGPERVDHVYLSDFGLTKRFSSHSGLTRTGQFVGTLDYIAPEQIEGKDVDARTDVYSLGCVLYESLTATVPFEKPTEAAVLWAHMQEDPPPATARRNDLPLGVDRVIATAMAKRPDDRYESCTSLVEDFRDVLDRAPDHAVHSRVPPGATIVGEDSSSETPASDMSTGASAAGRTEDRSNDAIGTVEVPDARSTSDASGPDPYSPEAARLSRRRFSARVVASGVAIALLVGGLVGWTVGMSRSGPTAVAGGGSEIYRRILLDHVSPSYRGRCHQSPNEPPADQGDLHLTADGVFAVASCNPLAGIQIRLYLIHSTEGMLATFYDVLHNQGVQPSEVVFARLRDQLANVGYALSSVTPSQGGLTCGAGSTATLDNRVANLWTRSGDTGHQEQVALSSTSDPAARVAGGLVACYRSSDSGTYVMVWTDNQTTVLGIATSAQQPTQLYRFWARSAGPLQEAPGMGM